MFRWWFNLEFLKAAAIAALLFFPLAAAADADAMTRILKETPTPQRFSFCWGGTCAAIEQVGLTPTEWSQVRGMFDPMPRDAESERETVRAAIGLLESIVGSKTGTSGDRAGTFGNSAWPGQLDCNDEATNSTNYMRMMHADGLMRFHEILDTRTRGGFLIFGRHSTAVIAETGSMKKFAVDSWFYDNGKPAIILPLDTWQAGWKPDNSAAH
ncbi:MAG TPA: hypothetical protein VK959_09035 [Methylophilaceae bacterium]|nr:hypothetical protein [Methylophilaceae bacterium]